jgi:hypothetical protein
MNWKLFFIPFFLLACNAEHVVVDDHLQMHDKPSHEYVDKNDQDKMMYNEKEKLLINAVRSNPEGLKENFDLGAFYHNLAIRQIRHTDSLKYSEMLKDPSSLDIPMDILFYNLELDGLESSTFALFNRSKYYLEIAYQQDSTNELVIDGLAGCYFALYDEKYDWFMKKVNVLNKQ